MLKKELPALMEISFRTPDKKWILWANATMHHLRFLELKNYSSDWIIVGIFSSENKARSFANSFANREKI
tara:strand:+ start:1716 stop:1925 length:210 start_codon:yes stop_codon:yes gene_type:complete